MWKIFDLSESPTVDFQITGRGKVTTETHSFLCMYDNFNKLLIIIAALCDYSAIKHQERGAANQIAKMTDEIGSPVTDDTIRKVLSKIHNALETRMK